MSSEQVPDTSTGPLGYPKFPGDALLAQRIVTEPRAPLDRPQLATTPSWKHRKELTTIDLLVCIVLPFVGVIAGIVRIVRGDPTGLRMFLISTGVLVVATLQGWCFRL